MKRMIGIVVVLGVGLVGCGQDPEAGLSRARKDTPPPSSTVPCRVTGGGQIEWGGSPDSFGGNAQPFRRGVDGEWNHVTHDGAHFHGDPDFIECYVDANDEQPPEAGAAAIRFTGTGSFEGEECAFEVYIEDHGEPGTSDYYEITIDCPSDDYFAGNTLLHGNLQIHAVPPGHLPR